MNSMLLYPINHLEHSALRDRWGGRSLSFFSGTMRTGGYDFPNAILGTGTSAFPVQCSDVEGLPGSGRAECCDVRECCIYGHEE